MSTVHRLFYSRYSVHYANIVAVAAQLLPVNINPKCNYERFIIFLSLCPSKPQVVCSCIQYNIVIIITSSTVIVPFKKHNLWKEGKPVSVHMLQVSYCYTVSVHIVRSLGMSRSATAIQHVSWCHAKNIRLFTKILIS